MRDQEIFISWRHKWTALVIALVANSVAFVLCWTMLSEKPVPLVQAAWTIAAVDFIPAVIVGRRLLQRPKLDIFRFWLAGAVASLTPAFILLVIPFIGVMLVGMALPCILAGSFSGSTTAWLYLLLAGQIPADAR